MAGPLACFDAVAGSCAARVTLLDTAQMLVSTVLLIEDDDDIRAIVVMSLHRVGGFNIVAVASGLEGLVEAERRPPDVILLDVSLRGCDGPTTLRHLRSNPRTASIPVIFITAKAQRHELATYSAMGAEGVITKPFDPLQLPAKIQRILDGRRLPPPRNT